MEAEPSNPPEVYKNAAGFAPPVVTTTVSAGGRTYVNLDSKNWQGGTTTVVTPSSAAPLFADLQSHTMMEERKVNRGGGRKSASLKDEDLCPEEEERRRIRRERNKLAAARCRKRRVDQTETLSREVEGWEEKKRLLQEEISALQAEREELQFILAAHATQCRRAEDQQQPAGPRVIAVKEEPAAARPPPPASLSLPAKSNSNSLLSQHGITIETPTNAISSLNFEALMEGRTGLTPTNVLTPININVNTSLASLNTPVCTAAFTPGSCGCQPSWPRLSSKPASSPCEPSPVARCCRAGTTDQFCNDILQCSPHYRTVQTERRWSDQSNPPPHCDSTLFATKDFTVYTRQPSLFSVLMYLERRSRFVSM